MRVILSGGGTAGHINPAIAVAEELLRQSDGEARILFVGARGKMEMRRVPALGYDIVGLPVEGLHRRLTVRNIVRNLLFPLRLWQSEWLAKRIIRRFRADMVVGFGGYASAPVLRAAQRIGIPTIIQEQNSYPGLANRRLARGAKYICVAYSGMEHYFPAHKIRVTGNPLRSGFKTLPLREEALGYFGLSDCKPVVLVVGGSLGSRTLNEAVLAHCEALSDVQIIWQTGSYYAAEMDQRSADLPGLWRGAYIERMDLALAAASVVISRAGAMTVSELCLAGKATIFAPSPNVSEDHQTKNARALVERNAALMVGDKDVVRAAIPMAVDLAGNPDRIAALERNIRLLATPDAAREIVALIYLCVEAKPKPQIDTIED